MNLRELTDMLASKGVLRQVVQPLVSVTEEIGDLGDKNISEITHDSRNVIPGALFACIRGGKQDGHLFANEARKRGASALLCENDTGEEIVHLIVDDARRRVGEVASAVYGNPSSSMKMVAVTGTNGKSTTSFMLRSIMGSSGEKAGIVGTIVYDDGSGIEMEAKRTTPEATDIQRLLVNMSQNGCNSCVMEASSHGLSQYRLSGCLFDGAVFTNLTPEHLDFHGTMENYFASKVRLFQDHMKGSGWKVSVNNDDPYGRVIREMFKGNVLSFGLEKEFSPDYLGEIEGMNLEKIEMAVYGPFNGSPIRLKLPVTGSFNARNALGAASLSFAMGYSAENIIKGLENLPQVPGRLQRVSLPGGVTALIDYAHTPDALFNVLSAVREVCNGEIWSVFGLGGDRFHENRPVMGDIASRIADHLVITMDNPRSEDPASIADQIVAGIPSNDDKKRGDRVIILDRKEAVEYALDRAATGDAVLISGKGPEKNIVFSDRVIPYSDLEAVEEWLKRRDSK